MLDANNFPVIDPDPGIPLAQVFPVATRARALVARNKQHALVQSNFWNIWGAVDMIEGLEHHHSSFLATIGELSTFETMNFTPAGDGLRRQLHHEVVAYLNRLGQFYSFARSQFVTARIPNVYDLLPTIINFNEMRDKHAAHRSIDAPRRESEQVQWLQAWALSSLSSHLFQAKQEQQEHDIQQNVLEPLVNSIACWKDRYVGFQMKRANGEHFVDFFLEREHPVILSEALEVVEQLVK